MRDTRARACAYRRLLIFDKTMTVPMAKHSTVRAKRKIALLPAIGAFVGLAYAAMRLHQSGEYWSAQTGSTYWDGIWKGFLGYWLGFQQDQAGVWSWKWELLLQGTIPVLALPLLGWGMHKALNKAGVNRALAAIPYVQL